MDLPEKWHGKNQYFLMFLTAVKAEQPTIEIIDLDRSGWKKDQGWIFRAVGELYLVRKEKQAVVFSVHLNPGDQGFYAAHHVGMASGVGVTQNEVVVYGIGKKRANGNMDNLWIMPWGQVCSGIDHDYFGLEGLKKGLR